MTSGRIKRALEKCGGDHQYRGRIRFCRQLVFMSRIKFPFLRRTGTPASSIIRVVRLSTRIFEPVPTITDLAFSRFWLLFDRLPSHAIHPTTESSAFSRSCVFSIKCSTLMLFLSIIDFEYHPLSTCPIERPPYLSKLCLVIAKSRAVFFFLILARSSRSLIILANLFRRGCKKLHRARKRSFNVVDRAAAQKLGDGCTERVKRETL